MQTGALSWRLYLEYTGSDGGYGSLGRDSRDATVTTIRPLHGEAERNGRKVNGGKECGA
jgi:hypothetical protein